MTGAAAGDRYVVISADCHAGASMDTYREYLVPSLRAEYDAWRATFAVPFEDLRDTGSEEYRRNFDSTVRQRDLEADGIVAEVVFPNTIPPFFSSFPFLGGDPGTVEAYRRQWAGLQAHNRWLVDFCAELPGRRAGVAQILLRDVDAALAEIRWTKEAGLFGGILLPIPVAGTDVPPLNATCYEPLWALCEDLDVPITVHGGGGAPDEGDHPGTGAMIFMEHGWYAIRPLHRLVFAGVFERHPRLRFAITETTGCWVPQTLANMDWMWERLRTEGTVQSRFGGDEARRLPLPPSGYWRRNCWQGASFMGPTEAAARYDIGVDRLMWGSDYPHHEGTHPYTREALRMAFADVDPAEVQLIVGGNAAALYGFDLAALAPIAARVGPSVTEVATPVDPADIPADAHCEALTQHLRPAGRFC
jgi:predicted TIM-barrel fold metal-dependent hydrolase